MAEIRSDTDGRTLVPMTWAIANAAATTKVAIRGLALITANDMPVRQTAVAAVGIAIRLKATSIVDWNIETKPGQLKPMATQRNGKRELNRSFPF